MSGVGRTFYTTADAGYFPGVVGLLNSLRLTGNDGELVVLDLGLASGQRARLERHARVVDLAEDDGQHPNLRASFPALLEPDGVVFLVDADLIVTRSLDEIAGLAEAGRICVYPDHPTTRERWWPEWAPVLGLEAPLRRGEVYANAGLVALSVERHPGFLPRFHELVARIPPGVEVMGGPPGPFWAADQDVLNALLMSEVAPDAVHRLPAEGEAYFDELGDVRVVDERTLACARASGPVTLLHYAFAPKPWHPGGWARARRDAYVRLLRRVLFSADLSVRLDPAEVPLWLRPGVGGRATLGALDAVHGAARGAVRVLPGRARGPLVGARNRLVARLRR
jgi:hypothetical protein